MEFYSSSRMIWIIGGAIAVIILLYMGSEFQRVSTSMFASPDETAVYVFAQAWTPGGGFRLPHGLPPDIQEYAGLHPRSMVRQGEFLVPVGFLGMPLLAALSERIRAGAGAYLTLLLVLTAAYPLWNLAGSWRRKKIAALTVLFFLTFPTVLLYENRGLFPNLPVVALALWSVWAWQEIGVRYSVIRGTRGMWNEMFIAIIAGLTLGLVLIIRPLEAVWVLPWVAWGMWRGWEKSASVMYGVAAGIGAAVCGIGVWVAAKTYPYATGGYLPPVGYVLRDQAMQQTIVDTSSRTEMNFRLPYGFHPRAVWENVRVYMLTYLGLWTGTALAGMYAALRREWKREQTIFLAMIAWTVLSLLFMYGQSVYADNIRGNASLGNSFLRYLLPLTPLLAYGMALAVEAAWRLPHRGNVLGAMAAIFLLLAGIVTAYARDEEGILQTRYEIGRYAQIRRETERSIPAGSIILSERSDKIFASGSFTAVSPIPDAETLSVLQASPHRIFLFHRLPSSDTEPFFGFSGWKLLYYIGNEGMYLLKDENVLSSPNMQFFPLSP